MAGLLPQGHVHHLWRLDLTIAIGILNATDVLLDDLPDLPALRVPEHHPRRLFLGVKEIEFLPQLAVIPLLCLLQTMQVSLERLLVLPGGTVNSLQHLVFRVTAPIGSRHLGQLERLQLCRIGNVRATTEVNEVPLLIEGQVLIRRNALKNLHLVFFAHLVEQGDRIIPGHHRPGDGQVGLGNLLHALLDLFQVLWRKRTVIGEVIIKAVVNHRADRDLGRGKELLNSLGHEVRAGMAQHFQAIVIPGRDDRQFGIPVNGVGRVYEFAIDPARQGCFGKPGTDRLGDLVYGHRGFELLLTTVRQGYGGHIVLAFSGDPYQRPLGSTSRLSRNA